METESTFVVVTMENPIICTVSTIFWRVWWCKNIEDCTRCNRSECMYVSSTSRIQHCWFAWRTHNPVYSPLCQPGCSYHYYVMTSPSVLTQSAIWHKITYDWIYLNDRPNHRLSHAFSHKEVCSIQSYQDDCEVVWLLMVASRRYPSAKHKENIFNQVRKFAFWAAWNNFQHLQVFTYREVFTFIYVKVRYWRRIFVFFSIDFPKKSGICYMLQSWHIIQSNISRLDIIWDVNKIL